MDAMPKQQAPGLQVLYMQRQLVPALETLEQQLCLCMLGSMLCALPLDRPVLRLLLPTFHHSPQSSLGHHKHWSGLQLAVLQAGCTAKSYM
jgi:hypothetical protein